MYMVSLENITSAQRTPLGQIEMAVLCASLAQWSRVGSRAQICFFSKPVFSVIKAHIRFLWRDRCSLAVLHTKHHMCGMKTSCVDLTPFASTRLRPTVLSASLSHFHLWERRPMGNASTGSRPPRSLPA